ncbi:FecR family protein [Sphingobacterium chuzhouense]|uniref:FecR domain-containing protein n=1 Tax=Sphingobacterium chuzhouense TaxID=1742264 RepID=A0ABR7XPH7_9SPHI|nr:FecR domain-containing protein [Sphingobacterium chuzhouense]MBD1421073.1 FecR domain-containing protein [Sphingobacterium chuzhouense]
MRDNQFRGYTVIDLLKDEDFLRWQLLKSEEDALFWKNVINRHPDLAPIIEEAISLYKTSVRFNNFSMTPAEISERREQLQYVIGQKKKKNARYVMLRAIAVAACIMVAILPFLWKKSEDVQQKDITTFAQALPEVDFNDTDTRLVLGEDQVVTLHNTESSVQYGVDDIVADDNIILQKEVTTSYNQLITPHGKRSTIIFSDGTKAWVNAGTKLVYPNQFSKENREIYVNGEIYIEVVEDKNRPFIVKTKRMDISVLGTKFNVSAYEVDHINNVALLSGSVSIASAIHKKDVVLKPNQLYSNTEGTPSIKTVDASMYALWTQGLYRFESEALGDIIKRLERYYGVKITCDDQAAHLKCSGKLDLKDNLDILLTDLTRALPINYLKNADGDYTIY